MRSVGFIQVQRGAVDDFEAEEEHNFIFDNKTMNNKPPSIHVEVYNFQNTFTHLPHISSMNPVSLEPRSPLYRCRKRGSEA